MSTRLSSRLPGLRSWAIGASVGAVAGTVGLVGLPPVAEAAPTLPANCSQTAVGGTVTCTFDYTGGEQTFTVPSGVRAVTLTAWGGSGSDVDPFITRRIGGNGALVSGTFPVLAGDVLTVVAAGAGQGIVGGYGFGRGGNGDEVVSGAGGGASSVENGEELLLVAGGGGGGGRGVFGCLGGLGGDGGHDGDPGECGSVPGGLAGSQAGPDGASASQFSHAGAGGGGYRGGGVGTASTQGGGGGGGGTSYAAPSGTSVSLDGVGNRGAGAPGRVTVAYEPAGPATQLSVSPESGSVEQGQAAEYTVTSYNAEGASLADVTSSATLSISPDGSCSGAFCTPAEAGAHVVTATYGTLTATASLDVTPPPIRYTFDLKAPVDVQPVVNKAKAGSSIPVKFSLGADYGLDVLVGGGPSSAKADCGTGAIDHVEETVSTNKQGLTYDATSGTYTYIWSTNKTWSGTCRTLTLVLADGQTQTISFSFK